MRTLVAWDNPEEAQLLNLYLGLGDNKVTLTFCGDDLLAAARQWEWDAILMSVAFPKTPQESFPLFQEIQKLQAGVPVLMACRPEEMMALPRFLTNGLRFYVIRDAAGDYVFLLTASIESAIMAAQAERFRGLAARLREEMDGVRKLQESIIPRGLIPPPGYALAARYEPSQVTVVGDTPVVMAGGDYYDMFQPDDRTLVVLVGDASGHGLKACMSIMVVHTLVRMLGGSRFRDTAAFVAEINDRLCENSIVQSEGGFITLFYAAIDTLTHTMTWTSAGHPLAQLCLQESNEVKQVGSDDDTGLPLGVLAGGEYVSRAVILPENSRVLLYTDGLTDAFAQDTPGHRAFGVQGVIDTLKNTSRLPLAEAMEKLFEVSQGFTGGSGRHDDTSVVLVERCYP